MIHQDQANERRKAYLDEHGGKLRLDVESPMP